MARIVARYHGTCTSCGEPIRRGDTIEYSRTTGAYHPTCVNAAQNRTAPDARREAINILQRLIAEMKRGPQTAEHTSGDVILRTDRMRWVANDRHIFYQDAEGTWITTWTSDLEITLIEIAHRLQERHTA